MNLFKIISAACFCVTLFEYSCAMKRPAPEDMHNEDIYNDDWPAFQEKKVKVDKAEVNYDNMDSQDQSSLMQLPKELFLRIIKKLPAADILNVASSCKDANHFVVETCSADNLQLSLIDCLGNDQLLKKFKVAEKDNLLFHILEAMMMDDDYGNKPKILKAIAHKVIKPFLKDIAYKVGCKNSDELTPEENLWTGINAFYDNKRNLAELYFEDISNNQLVIKTNPWIYYMAKFFIGYIKFLCKSELGAREIFIDLCVEGVGKVNPWVYIKALSFFAYASRTGMRCKKNDEVAFQLYNKIVDYTNKQKAKAQQETLSAGVISFAGVLSLMRLGVMFYLGNGVEKNYKQAFVYFDSFVSHPQTKQLFAYHWLLAQFALGKMLYLGQGVKKEYQYAYVHFNAFIEHLEELEKKYPNIREDYNGKYDEAKKYIAEIKAEINIK